MEEYMNYDRETHLKISLAESSLIEQLISLARVVEDSVNELSKLIQSLASPDIDTVRSIYERIRYSKENAESIKDSALAYLAKLGTMLVTADVYRVSFLSLARIAANIDGIAHKARLMVENGFARLPPMIVNGITEIADIFRRQYLALHNAIRMLPENPSRGYEEVAQAFNLEEEIDVRYRQITLSLYRALKEEIIALLIIKDLIELLEDTADTVKEAAENIRFIALHRAARM